MSNSLKIGSRIFDGDQIISALVQYKLLETLVGQVVLDEVVEQVPLTQNELFQALVGPTNAPVPEDFDDFLNQWCERKGVAPSYLNSVMLRDLRVEKFKQLYFADQIESEFLRTKSDFDQVEYSLIQLTDLALAQELYFQIRDDGASFAELAEQHSLGRERQMGGLIGPVPMSTLPVEVATLFSSGEAGSVYGPVPIADRFWLVRLEQMTSARLTEATRTNLVNRLYNQWLQNQIKKVVSTPGMIAVQPNALEPSSVPSAG
ncbi:peptidylprolyl isomerase [Oculatella sp. LEGE 06141]|uniref:peptidylprolyl isomerase n=1 Tax=Oculatella sp. LEGE 06141 TaxID=1828648 RepID=UPI0018809A20|nr:peptidylprolyl isomerase [Oculatella sp. LEGE 06141]MBE9180072.1 peptidylprolyl isomerase [Oculatella sp. LEGE 06141]